MDAKKTAALAALLTEPTRAAAARRVGIDERTLRRYLVDPDFSAEYQSACAGLVSEAAQRAQNALCPALDTLVEIMRDENKSDAARISAARAVLEQGGKLAELANVLAKRAEGARYELF